jgi:hypothetical protein
VDLGLSNFVFRRVAAACLETDVSSYRYAWGLAVTLLLLLSTGSVASACTDET